MSKINLIDDQFLRKKELYNNRLKTYPKQQQMYDYDWIDDLAGAVIVLKRNMNLPEPLLDELSQVSDKLTEIYSEACDWEAENMI